MKSLFRGLILDFLAVFQPKSRAIRGEPWIVSMVRRIDPSAADYMPTHKRSLQDMKADSLFGVFIWDDTPQGFDFWFRLDLQLRHDYPDEYPRKSKV